MRKFSHIYIESDAYNYPITKDILEKFPDSIQLEIKDYKHIFNRPNQDFLSQKNSIKLILAVKKDNFYYPGSNVVNNYGYKDFYYNTLVLNCLYNCEYCYLQGMFNSGNIVVFVNLEDFFDATRELSHNHPIYLCISYETDLLAFERVVPYTSKWILFARENPNVLIETRTKSNQYNLIQNLTPVKNVILAWTISPEIVIKNYEKGAAVLNQRLNNIKNATKDGWNVRICIDPILHLENWKEIYKSFIQKTFSELKESKIYDISLGSFRINADYLKKMKKMRTNSKLLYYPFERQQNLSAYKKEKAQEMISFVASEIETFINKERIFIS
ncbi:MAG TPA: DNA photolyase [Leptospiraceae bacterium]|nr:DNA photolyase [Leptospiraceae bacterium]HMW04528.1 DNA photolyase [Leptospiraceae bacterium]HMX31186.1 DNA photolyase [Leptospiraceae bacterium]HMY30714.1 DNA photolyase [Leptospiraceae bacterium]HMZ63217.1 DNA photolyase [Leptospiraceae bacterium]